MDSSQFAIGVTWRATLVGVSSFLATFTLFTQHHYASTVVCLAIASLTALDLGRFSSKADRLLSRIFLAMSAGEMELPSNVRQTPGLSKLSDTLKGFQTQLSEARAKQHREIEYARSLIDTVTTAIITFDGSNRTLVNRAAQKLFPEHALGHEVDLRLATLVPGDRAIIKLGTGQRMLSTVTQFSAGSLIRVVSLQSIDNELDEAEIKAWQDLTRILAHEMMNSLTPVVSLAQSLRPLVQNNISDIKDAVEVIANRSQGLMEFVERYRSIAELPRPILSPIQMNTLLTNSANLVRANLEGATLSVSVEPADLTFDGDRQLLEQALINLLHNAVDAVAGIENPRIDLSCRLENENVILEVCDNGQGIPPDIIERIFVPFFTTKSNGSGIGLSLVRQIAVAHSGQTEARSSPAGCTTFRLVLPKSAVALQT